MEHENKFFEAVKALLYLFMVGCLYYTGGYGWALLFTRKDHERERAARYNIYLLVIEIILIILLVIIGVSQDHPNYALPCLLIKAMIIHIGINVIGLFFYVVWYVAQLFKHSHK